MKVSSSTVRPDPARRLQARLGALSLALVMLVGLVFIPRLLFLQTARYQRYLRQSVVNQIRSLPIPAPRGEIVDRNGVPLAENLPQFSLKLFVPGDGNRLSQVLAVVAERTGLSYTDLTLRVEEQRRILYPFQPVTLVDDLNEAQLAWFSRHRNEFPELFIDRFGFRRYYPLGGASAHLVGYVGQLSASELEQLRAFGYQPGDQVGKGGVERSFEAVLRGTPGEVRLMVDRDGRFRGLYEVLSPKRGTSLKLTIDARLQQKAYQLLGGRPGAIIVSAVKTGEILALVSSPAYDPNDFYSPEGRKQIRLALTDDLLKPFFNRAISGAYPPGSVFKPVVAQAALQENLVDPYAPFEDQGYIEVGDPPQRFRTWKPGGHGTVDFFLAMAESVDTYFYELGLKLGARRIAHYARLFGYGEKVGIPIPGEVAGLLPTPEWKRAYFTSRYDRIWYTGDTVNLSIGQGFLTATPLQVLWMMNLIARGGTIVPPRLIRARLAGDKELPEPQSEPVRVPLTTSDLGLVKQALRRVVSDPKGTAHRLNTLPVKVAGKTGTAQAGKELKDHAWFVAYFPYEDPAYSLVVFLEHGGSGSEEAVPIAGRLIRAITEYDPLGVLTGSS